MGVFMNIIKSICMLISIACVVPVSAGEQWTTITCTSRAQDDCSTKNSIIHAILASLEHALAKHDERVIEKYKKSLQKKDQRTAEEKFETICAMAFGIAFLIMFASHK